MRRRLASRRRSCSRASASVRNRKNATITAWQNYRKIPNHGSMPTPAGYYGTGAGK